MGKIDLATLDTTKACDVAQEIELRHPQTNAPLGEYISIVGRDSNKFRVIVAKQANQDRKREFEARRRGKGAVLKTFEESEAEGIEILVACTTGLRELHFKGALLPYSDENVRMLYTESLFIRQQVDSAIGDLENFMKP